MFLETLIEPEGVRVDIEDIDVVNPVDIDRPGRVAVTSQFGHPRRNVTREHGSSKYRQPTSPSSAPRPRSRSCQDELSPGFEVRQTHLTDNTQ